MTPLERALLIARRNWILLLVCFLVVPGAALAYSLAQTPEYTASASLLFTEKDTSQVNPERAAATNLQLVSLDQVAARTADALPDAGLTVAEISSKVSVAPPANRTWSRSKPRTRIRSSPRRSPTSSRGSSSLSAATRTGRRSSKHEGLVEARLNELTPAQLAGPEGASPRRTASRARRSAPPCRPAKRSSYSRRPRRARPPRRKRRATSPSASSSGSCSGSASPFCATSSTGG